MVAISNGRNNRAARPQLKQGVGRVPEEEGEVSLHQLGISFPCECDAVYSSFELDPFV
jgi:hypothetical protein